MIQPVGLIFSIPVRSDGPDWNLPTHAHLSCFNVFAIVWSHTVDSHLHHTPSHFRTPVYFHLSRWSGLCLVLSVTYGDRYPPYTPLLVRFIILPFLPIGSCCVGRWPVPLRLRTPVYRAFCPAPCVRPRHPLTSIYQWQPPCRTRDDIGLLAFEPDRTLWLPSY